MKMWAKSSRGFTIVELLIVIVIIGVLAALVVTSYNGIQQRANNSKTASVVQAYRKALIQYATVNGSYPMSTTSYCLGDGYPSGCGSNGAVAENSTAEGLLKPYMGGQLPLPSTKAVPYISNIPRTGAWYTYYGSATLDGVSHPWFLMYMMDGYQQKCSAAPVASFSPYGTFTSTPPASGYSETTSTSGGGTFCTIALPNPATL